MRARYGNRAAAPFACFNASKVGFRQFNWLLAPAPSPAIAFNAAHKTLTVVVDFDQG
jgi:hypothetical protein